MPSNNYGDFEWDEQEKEASATGAFADFDWSDASTPELGAATPQVSQETLAATSAAPQAAPEAAPVESMVPAVTEKEDIAATSQEQLGAQGVELSPYLTGASYGTGIEQIGEQAQVAGESMSPEGRAEAQEFIREEALPVVGATVGTLLAPVSGGSSIPLAMAFTAGTAGLGAAAGEAVEQTAKFAGMMELAKDETAPKDAWDILERSAWRGGEEAAWTLLPDMLIRGTSQGVRRLLTKGAKSSETIDGDVIDMGRKSMQDIMEGYAERKGLKKEEVLLTSDIVESGLFNASENIASNSYISGKVAPVRATQEKALKEEIMDVVTQYKGPAEGYVKGSSDEAIRRFVEPNMDGLNDFGVAGLVNVGFKKAQEAQKAVARSTYKAIGNLMERTKMVSVYKEVELPFLGPDGRPMTTMQTVLQEQPAFPVSLRKVREIAEDRMDILARTGDKLDPYTSEFLNMPYQTDYEAAAERLIDMKADSRSLGRSTAEGAGKQKLNLDRAIKEMEQAMDDAMGQAELSGIVGPDGTSLRDLKAQADSVWSEQVADFQNSYIKNIINKTNPKNGAPEKLGKLFIQNDTAARNIMKVIDDAKAGMTGADLEQLVQTENAIKGSIVEELFIPFDGATGQYIAPDMTTLVAKEDQLKRIFGEESFDELRKLGAAIQQQEGGATSNYLGFAQRARESGMMMSTIKSMSNLNFGPLLRDGGSTVLFALGAGRLLTSPKMIRQVSMLNNPTVDPAIKTQIAQWLVHRTYEYQQAIEASVTPEERERMEAKLEDVDEAKRMRQGN